MTLPSNNRILRIGVSFFPRYLAVVVVVDIGKMKNLKQDKKPVFPRPAANAAAVTDVTDLTRMTNEGLVKNSDVTCELKRRSYA